MLERLTVQQAARQLGVSEGAIRMRLSRGSLEQEKDDNGRVWVLLRSDNSDIDGDNSDNTEHHAGTQTDGQAEIGSLVEVLRDQVAYLRDQLDQEREARTEERRRHDTIIAQLTQANAALAGKVPELEAAPDLPPEQRESPVTSSSELGNDEGEGGRGHQDPEQRRSWLYRFFFGP
jgi:DNA-binding transcriptional MerR regulator